MASAADFDWLSLERLCERTSEKWAHYPPRRLAGVHRGDRFLALAPAVHDALAVAVDAGDCGYERTLSDLGERLSQRFAARRFSVGPVWLRSRF